MDLPGVHGLLDTAAGRKGALKKQLRPKQRCKTVGVVGRACLEQPVSVNVELNGLPPKVPWSLRRLETVLCSMDSV